MTYELMESRVSWGNKTGVVKGHEGLWELCCHQRPRRLAGTFRAKENLGTSQFTPIRSVETRTKDKPRNTLSFQLPLLGEGDFHCGERPGGAGSHEICVPILEPSLTCDVNLPSNVVVLVLQTWVGWLNK